MSTTPNTPPNRISYAPMPDETAESYRQRLNGIEKDKDVNDTYALKTANIILQAMELELYPSNASENPDKIDQSLTILIQYLQTFSIATAISKASDDDIHSATLQLTRFSNQLPHKNLDRAIKFSTEKRTKENLNQLLSALNNAWNELRSAFPLEEGKPQDKKYVSSVIDSFKKDLEETADYKLVEAIYELRSELKKMINPSHKK